MTPTRRRARVVARRGAALATAALVVAVATTTAAQDGAPAAPDVGGAPRAAAPQARRLGYAIHVVFDPDTRELTGSADIVFPNTTGEPLSAIPVHLYLNAFAHTATTWSNGAMSIRDFDVERFLDAFPDPWGSIEITSATMTHDGAPAPIVVSPIQPDDGNALDRSLALLETPVIPPDAVVTFTLAFRARLPLPIARTGAVPGYAHVAQWFPKLGVYDPPGHGGRPRGGFVARQFHGPTEFYADFATYDVILDVPAGTSVVATGVRVDAAPSSPSSTTAAPRAGYVRYRFHADDVHDFAWVAARAPALETFVHTPPAQAPIEITVVVPPGRAHDIAPIAAAARTTFDVLAQRVGPYPYPKMTVLAPPWAAAETGGMEYPMLVGTTPSDALFDLPGISSLRLFDATTAHEIAHNYFYGVLATDEQREAFLDEGFTSYWESEIMDELDRQAGGPGRAFGFPMDWHGLRRARLARVKDRVVEPVVKRPAALFLPGTHGHQIYTRSALILETAENRFGTDVVDAIFRAYFARHRMTHPTSEDFFTTASEIDPRAGAFLREAFFAPRIPDFAVDDVTSAPWEPPHGLVPGPDGLVNFDADDVDDARRRALSLDKASLDDDAITLVITDPGFTDDGRVHDGEVRREVRAVTRVDAEPGFAVDADAFFTSRVRVRGPALAHLPIEIELTFADGARVIDAWDGRAPWRELVVVRRAPLVSVVLDPRGEIVVDGDPGNDAWRAAPPTDVARPVASRVAAFITWLVVLGARWL